MQMMHCDKAAVSRAAELLHCGPHSFVREGYDAYAMKSWKPGVHRAARTSWASSGAGVALNRLLSDALAPHYAKIQRIERGCHVSASVRAENDPKHASAAANNATADVEQVGAYEIRDDSQRISTDGVRVGGSGDASGSPSSLVPVAVQDQLLAMERELQEVKERTERLRVAADGWRVSATRWRTVVVTMASVAAVVALALFSRRRVLPRRF